MESTKSAIEIVEIDSQAAAQEAQFAQLAELTLALVGGGTGDVII
jgi:hypothetical protein